jgi:hypothetical protein
MRRAELRIAIESSGTIIPWNAASGISAVRAQGTAHPLDWNAVIRPVYDAISVPEKR